MAVSDKVTKWVGAWSARRLSFITDREIRDEYLVPSFDIVARIRAKRLTWAGHQTHLSRRVAIARLQKDLQEHSSLRTTTWLFQELDAPDHKAFEELKELKELELQKRKKLRKARSSGATNTMDHDAS